MKPILFTTKTCSKCPSMKMWLDRNDIDYDIVDVTDDVKLLEPAYSRSGLYSVPQLLSNDEVVVGLDYGKAKRITKKG